MNIIGIIPARLKSERFPNKLLALINGVSLIKRAIQNANKLNIDKLVLVTDSGELIDFIKVMKNVDIELHYQQEEVSCGSERVKFVYDIYPNYDYYMSIPADEPFIDVDQINLYLDILKQSGTKYNISSFYSPFYSEERLKSSLSCKIVTNKKDEILYCSRAIIPALKNCNINSLELYKKHLGIFIFTNSILKQNLWEKSELASYEGLEQNMFLENGYKIKALKIEHKYYGVDVKKQIKELEELYDFNK